MCVMGESVEQVTSWSQPKSKFWGVTGVCAVMSACVYFCSSDRDLLFR